MVADQPVLLVRHRAGVSGQTARTVHLVRALRDCGAGMVASVCGSLLRVDELDRVEPGEGMPCPECVLDHAVARADGAPESNADGGCSGGSAYQQWGWPVAQHGDQIQLSPNCDASAVAIPISLSPDVTQVLTDRHCAPAVLADPHAPEHHLVLTGERFGAALPWPSGVYQVTGALLPPTMTSCGPITWVQPPSKDSLGLCREIDVFGALRTVLTA